MIKTQKSFANQLVSQVTGNIVSDMDGEMVMLSVSNGRYYNMGEIGGVIWEYLKKPVSIQELVRALTIEYEVEQNECEEHVTDFLGLLYDENLINLEKTPVS